MQQYYSLVCERREQAVRRNQALQRDARRACTSLAVPVDTSKLETLKSQYKLSVASLYPGWFTRHVSQHSQERGLPSESVSGQQKSSLSSSTARLPHNGSLTSNASTSAPTFSPSFHYMTSFSPHSSRTLVVSATTSPALTTRPTTVHTRPLTFPKPPATPPLQPSRHQSQATLAFSTVSRPTLSSVGSKPLATSGQSQAIVSGADARPTLALYPSHSPSIIPYSTDSTTAVPQLTQGFLISYASTQSPRHSNAAIVPPQDPPTTHGAVKHQPTAPTVKETPTTLADEAYATHGAVKHQPTAPAVKETPTTLADEAYATHGAVKHQPTAPAVKETPTTLADEAYATHGAVKHQPTAPAVKETPTTLADEAYATHGAVKHQPTAPTVKETPTTLADEAYATHGAVKHQPTAPTVKETPTTLADEAYATHGAVKHQPTAPTVKETPTTLADEAYATHGAVKHQPTAPTVKETPTTLADEAYATHDALKHQPTAQDLPATHAVQDLQDPPTCALANQKLMPVPSQASGTVGVVPPPHNVLVLSVEDSESSPSITPPPPSAPTHIENQLPVDSNSAPSLTPHSENQPPMDSNPFSITLPRPPPENQKPVDSNSAPSTTPPQPLPTSTDIEKDQLMSHSSNGALTFSNAQQKPLSSRESRSLQPQPIGYTISHNSTAASDGAEQYQHSLRKHLHAGEQIPTTVEESSIEGESSPEKSDGEMTISELEPVSAVKDLRTVTGITAPPQVEESVPTDKSESGSSFSDPGDLPLPQEMEPEVPGRQGELTTGSESLSVASGGGGSDGGGDRERSSSDEGHVAEHREPHTQTRNGTDAAYASFLQSVCQAAAPAPPLLDSDSEGIEDALVSVGREAGEGGSQAHPSPSPPSLSLVDREPQSSGPEAGIQTKSVPEDQGKGEGELDVSGSDSSLLSSPHKPGYIPSVIDKPRKAESKTLKKRKGFWGSNDSSLSEIEAPPTTHAEDDHGDFDFYM